MLLLAVFIVFLKDTWNGHELLKTFAFGRFSGVITEWGSFVAFLGVPLVVLFIGLFAQSTRWWELTALTWFASVWIFYCIFAVACVYYETTSCIALVRHHYCDNDASFLQVLKMSFLIRQTHYYSGYTRTSYLAKGALIDSIGSNCHSFEENHTKRTSIYSTIVQFGFLQKLGLFVKLETPEQTFEIEDAQDNRIFMTKTSWSLEKTFCRRTESRFVAVIRGPDSLSKAQLRSSVACSIIGTILIAILLSAGLTFLGFGVLIQLGYWGFALVVFIIPRLSHSWRLYQLTREIIGEMEAINHLEKITRKAARFVDNGIQKVAKGIEGGTEKVAQGIGNVVTIATDSLNITSPIKHDASAQDPSNHEEKMEEGQLPQVNDPMDMGAKDDSTEESENEAIFIVWESWRIVKPTHLWCWITLSIELVLFFIWPTIALFNLNNVVIAVIFISVVIFTYMRHEFNPAVVIKEIGNLNGVQGHGPYDKRDKQALLNEIISNVTTARGQNRWVGALSVLLIACLFLCFTTIANGQYNSDNTDYAQKQYSYVHDFKYEQAADLPYQTCNFGRQLFDDIPVTMLVDWVFAAAMSYRSNNFTQSQLDGWFGENVVKNREDIVTSYRESTGSVKLPVAYRLYEFATSKTAVVSIQGTTTTWDLFADAQLWSTAWLLQGLRSLLPFGQAWTPILDNIAFAISWLDSPNTNKLAFYKETTKFVKYLKESDLYENFALTGHSLGGGLSIITAAQTGVPAIAVSGPNAMISRHAFRPMLSVEQLNTLTFNLVPDRDPVAQIDDVGRLHQQIACRADFNDIFGCHSVDRTWCEVMHTCGSNGRPFVCECFHEWGYPEPIATGNRTFAEACPKPTSL